MRYEIKVSIIVPVYNVSRYLSKCLNSILGQSFQEFEIICIEDCSEDDSLRILEKYRQIDNRIIIIRNEKNMGLSYSRNIGLLNAKGKYVWFIDSDDSIYNPNAIKELYNTSEEYQLDSLMFDVKEEYESAELKREFRLECASNRCIELEKHTGIEMFITFMKNNKFNSMVQTQFFNKSFLVENGLRFAMIIHEDLLFSVKVLLRAQSVMYVSKPYYQYFRRQNSISTSKGDHKRVEGVVVSYVDSVFSLKNMQLSKAAEEVYVTWLIVLREKIVKSFLEWIKTDTEITFNSSMYDVVLKIILEEEFPYIWSKLYFDTYRAIKCKPYIIVYGAGKVSKSVIKFLEMLEIKNYFVAVTSGKREGVVELKELVAHVENSLILIAAMGEKQKDMISYAEELGFSNILTMC